MSLIFGPEAARRYHAWCGASASDALSMALRPGIMPAPFLPMSPDGVRYSASCFNRAMNAVASRLPADLPRPRTIITDVVEDGACREPSEAADLFPIVGLTGGRKAGKTVVAEALVAMGGVTGHPFKPGKAMLRGYYVSIGASEEEAMAMTDGELKDVPSARLNGHTSRLIMEIVGNHMGKTMGPEWSLGVELRRIREPSAPFALVESVVYEEEMIRSRPGSMIIRLSPAPGAENAPARGAIADAPLTDASASEVRADVEIVNEFDGKGRLVGKVRDALVAHGFVLPGEDPSPS